MQHNRFTFLARWLSFFNEGKGFFSINSTASLLSPDYLPHSSSTAQATTVSPGLFSSLLIEIAAYNRGHGSINVLCKGPDSKY